MMTETALKALIALTPGAKLWSYSIDGKWRFADTLNGNSFAGMWEAISLPEEYYDVYMISVDQPKGHPKDNPNCFTSA